MTLRSRMKSTVVDNDEVEDDEWEEEEIQPDDAVPAPHQEKMVVPAPVLPEKGRKAIDIDLSLAVDIWNRGYNSRRKLMIVFGLTDHQAGLLRTRILEQNDQQITSQDEDDVVE
jgi:hypothetical protein